MVHDAARTSILSKNWRCIWGKLPNLVLDKQFYMELAKKISKCRQRNNRYDSLTTH
ncbi:hypothetical protein MTR67_017484 [Solanum verrucosum]|uniref:Uncharacterized protein n=1 Tax=Solanum verrucosum TaxID=315347 RepID=A0AAF0TLV6_SOLVR|nr:hypothetical protein MTR67_017484 [Solanum verrucosum]